MPEARKDELKCHRCGHVHSTAVETCTDCGAAMENSAGPPAADAEWSTLRNSLKMRWVAAVMAFWVSAAVLVVVSFVDGQLNLILVSICLGLLMVGMWLKARYQLHLRKGPGGH